MWIFSAALVIFFALELIYFKIAIYFKIIDKPNLRSSHSQITLRGGGIIFPIAFICGISLFQPSLLVIGLAVFLIATISFLDDVLTINNKLRFFIHVLSVLLLIYQVYLINGATLNLIPQTLTLFTYSLVIVPSIIFIIGIINAYNFMDGINGITVLYSITTISSLWFIQDHYRIILLDERLWYLLLASLLVFSFFNLRKKAKAFAGDIGSISVALILCYLILQLILNTQELKWFLLLGIYGLDSVATIFCRIIRKENIFDAHRSHFYQHLANEQKWPHVVVSILYTFLQFFINLVLIFNENLWLIFSSFLLIVLIYISSRLLLEGKYRLFKNYNNI